MPAFPRPSVIPAQTPVIPAQAGIYARAPIAHTPAWIPAFAGVTKGDRLE